MNEERFQQRLVVLRDEPLPLPGGGDTRGRHARLYEIAREDVSLAKMMEAHWDALSILAEANREPEPGALYAVWASEIPGTPLKLVEDGLGYKLEGSKPFASGAALADRALITAGGQLVEVDLRVHASSLRIDETPWQTEAFRLTRTATVLFQETMVGRSDLICGPGWYTERPGFWHGACGPAACWAGGVAGLYDYAGKSRRADAHTLAHLAAIHANQWGLRALLDAAGDEIDRSPGDGAGARSRALALRHLVEQLCTDTLRRFARAYGPSPLAMDAEVSRRYHEVDLYLRQCHAERDLESLGWILRDGA